MTRRGISARIAIAFALLVLSCATPAAAAPRLIATINDISPALPSMGSTIDVNLQLENPGTKTISDLSAQFIISTAPLLGRSQISAISRGDLLPTYRTLEESAASDLSLSSGASITIPLRINTRALGLSPERPGVYTFGVLVDGSGIDAIRSITFLPWLPSVLSAKPLGVVPVVSLSAPPQRGIDGVFYSNSLAKSVAGGGRLRTQLDAMLLVGAATWLLDPLTLEAVQALSTGARIREDGEIRAASNDEMAAATQWLADLRVVATRGQLYAMPAGDMDVRAATKFGRRALVRDAVEDAGSRVDTVLGTRGVRTAVQIYDGSVTSSTWSFLRDAGIDAAFISDAAYRARQQRYTPSTALAIDALGSAPALVIDEATSATLASSRPEALQRQEFAAHLLMTYLEQPNKQRTITVSLPQTWSPDLAQRTSDILNAPWISQRTVPEALADGSEQRRVIVEKATARQLEQESILRGALSQQRLLLRLTADPVFSKSVQDSIESLASRWLTGSLTRDFYSAATTDQLRRYIESVRVVTRGDIVFGSEEGVVPVTIANGLPVPINVVLGAAGLPSVRVAPTASTELKINAGKRVSVELPTRVTGSGVAYLQLWLETADGSMLGNAVILNIRSAAYARIASYLVGAAFIALILLVAVNTVRRVRVRRRDTRS